ncbi:ABC transporter substrate-binding protein [Paenibacillus yanchengensis]|uniref:ABC transporter substrate-binding protein n=1 Tax=Paenibacillus yanchengensis TaxID=2035833 RepID=A0ABW4YGU5_9BACL
MTRKMLVTVLSVVLIMTALAACSGGKDEPSTEGETPTNNGEATTQPSDETGNGEATSEIPEPEGDLTWFGLMGQDQFEDRVGQYLKEKFPKLNITYINQTDEQRLEQIITSGMEIDMYFSTAGELYEDYIPANLATDLTTLIEKHGIDLDTFDSAYLDQVKVDDKLHLLPISDSKFVMYYNKDIFDRFGVDYPTDGMTWDQALELSKKLTRNEGGQQYVGLWLSPKHYLRVAQNSANFVDPETNKATVNNDDWKFIFEKIFYNFSRDPGVQQKATERWLAHGDFIKDFTMGMYVYTTVWMNDAENSLPFNWDVVSVPTFEEYAGLSTQPLANFVGVSATSKKQDTAMQVVKYLVSEEYQTIISKKGMVTPLKTQSVRDAAFEDYEFADSKNVDAVYYGTPAPGRKITRYDELVIEEAFALDAIVEIVRGKLDVNTALRQAEEKANKLIQEQMASE